MTLQILNSKLYYFAEYGLQCYRKNPQHKRDYKHTSNTRASKRKASKDLKKIAKKAAGNHLSGEDDGMMVIMMMMVKTSYSAVTIAAGKIIEGN